MTRTADWHRHAVVDAVRYLALDCQRQKRLCPPFVYLADMMQENIRDAVDCAFLFAAGANEVLFTPEQSEDLKRLVERINRWMQEDGRFKEQESPEFNSFWDGVRAEARDLLRRHGWEGEIDPQLYKYTDPVTGHTIVPNADSAQRRDAVQDQ